LLDRLDLRVQAGEIVGVAGVEGNGQSELIQALLRPRDPRCRSSGSVEILGRDVTRWGTRSIRELGVGLIPQDRHREGLLLNWSLQDNFLLGRQRERRFLARGWARHLGWIDDAAVCDATLAALSEFDVRPRLPEALASGLSGGNQQKLIISRESARESGRSGAGGPDRKHAQKSGSPEVRLPGFLIAAQPTRGVDVGAIEFIHRRLLAARGAGTGILLISSELDEIFALSDRIVVLFEGAIVARYSRGAVSVRELGLAMAGSRSGAIS
jgi:simple sugar transport system ATP-binding protein